MPTGLLRRSGLAIVPFVLVAGSLIGSASSPALADSCANFTALAAADGVRTRVSSPGFLVVEGTDAGSPVAQAQLDPYASGAYAAAPSPGDEALTALPLAGAPQDTYPLFVRSQFPTEPENRLETPVETLVATASARAADADALSGVSGTDEVSTSGRAHATSHVDCADSGEVTAAAESVVEAVSFAAGVFRLGEVHSVARVVIGTDGVAQLEATLEISGASIAGQSVSITEDGLALAGTPTLLPGNPFADVLSDAGIQITTVEATTQPDGQGITAPALQVQVVRDVTGGAPTTTTYTFGRAYAAAGSAAAPPPAAPAVAVPPVTPPPTSGSVSAPAPTTPASVAPTVTTPAVRLSELPTEAAVEESLPVRVLQSFSAWSIYAVLVVGAALVLSSGVLFKFVGVRNRWI
jgi:hypothetical protein